LGSSNTGWINNFAPIPSVVANDYLNNFTPIYVTQAVENYLPRYSSGPFLTYNNQFLYPNAQNISDIYISNLNGFPTTVKYSITIKEESVREIFLSSGINGNVINNHIIRANSNGQPENLLTTMINPFVPNNNNYKYTFNWLENTQLYPVNGGFFNSASLSSEMVNEDYIPNENYCIQTNLNSVIYQSNNFLFNQGVKYTGQLVNRNIYIKSGHTTITTGIAVSETAGGGLYWGYRSTQITGELVYVPPIFDLSTYSMNITSELSGAMISLIYGYTSPVFSNNGSIRYGSLYDNEGNYNGKDPIYYEYVGGRIGSGAINEGGYNSSGIIGDGWYQANAQQLGIGEGFCYSPVPYKDVENDQYVYIVALTSSGLNINIRGMYYYPYYLNWKYNPFLETISYPIGASFTPIQLGNSNSEFYFNVDLKQFFNPIQQSIQSEQFSGFYSTSGLTLGPFDRDVELCITGKNSIIPSGTLIIDGELMTNQLFDPNCVMNFIENFGVNSGIILGEAGRGNIVSTFKLIPSGNTTNINITGTGIIGLTGSTIITIRPRTCFGAVQNTDPTLISGDLGIMDNFRYINNGSENIFKFPNNSKFESLIGQTMDITTQVREEVLYPVPDSDFDSILQPTLDSFGNKIYSQKHPPVYAKIPLIVQ